MYPKSYNKQGKDEPCEILSSYVQFSTRSVRYLTQLSTVLSTCLLWLSEEVKVGVVC